MKKTILIIDDDEKLNNLLINYFQKFNFEVIAITDPLIALKKLEKFTPDIIILDVMLPHMEGFEVCKEIRKKYSVPIIMLTARGDVTDKIVGLELGADDYMAKPFEPRELVARIQTVLRRTPQGKNFENVKFSNLEIDFKKYIVRVNSVQIDITTMEFELLSLFAKNPGVVFSRDKIFEKVKGFDADSYDRSIDVMVSRLRQKLNDDPGKPQFIKTIWGSGYKFIGDINDE